MAEIGRFTFEGCERYRVHDDGEWVRYSDHEAAIHQERQRVREALEPVVDYDDWTTVELALDTLEDPPAVPNKKQETNWERATAEQIEVGDSLSLYRQVSGSEMDWSPAEAIAKTNETITVRYWDGEEVSLRHSAFEHGSRKVLDPSEDPEQPALSEAERLRRLSKEEFEHASTLTSQGMSGDEAHERGDLFREQAKRLEASKDGWAAPDEAIHAAWAAIEEMEGVPPVDRNVLAVAVSAAFLKTIGPVSALSEGVGSGAGVPSPRGTGGSNPGAECASAAPSVQGDWPEVVLLRLEDRPEGRNLVVADGTQSTDFSNACLYIPAPPRQAVQGEACKTCGGKKFVPEPVGPLEPIPRRCPDCQPDSDGGES